MIKLNDTAPTTIDEWFNLYVYQWMYHDLRRAIDVSANYLAALGLAVYSEALGGLQYPMLSPRKRFDKFLDLLPEEYGIINRKLIALPERDCLYHRVRCGLAHEYFVKNDAVIIRYPEKDTPCGVNYDETNDKLVIILENYFADFKKAAEKIHAQLKNDLLNEIPSEWSVCLHGTDSDFKKDPKYEYKISKNGEFMMKKKKPFNS